jgi:hypothetical protein
VSLLTDLDAFSTEHRGCGDLDGGVDGPIVWMACDCVRASRVEWTRMTEPPPGELDARGRRLSCRAVLLT